MEKSLGPASIAKLDPPYLQKASLNPSSLPNPSLNPASLQNPSLPFRRFFATCAPGLEEVVAAELAHPPTSASHVELGSSGVAFSGSFLTAYNANLWLRSAVRVLVEIASSPLLHQARSGPRRRDPVYEFVRECADWEEILAIDGDDSGNNGDDDDDYDDGDDDGDDDDDGEMVSHRMHPRSHGKLRMRRSVANDSRRSRSPRMHRRFRTFAVQTRARDCASVNNTMFASIRAKDAICDSIRDSRSGSSKPRPPREGGASADVPLFLSLYRDHASLYRDMSGLSLHRRGYRDAMHRASLNEAIAAGILTIAGWNSRIAGFGEFNAGGLIADVDKMVLLDPMCGSGTFLIEAALMACNRAPGLMRTHWPFQVCYASDSSKFLERLVLNSSIRKSPSILWCANPPYRIDWEEAFWFQVHYLFLCKEKPPLLCCIFTSFVVMSSLSLVKGFCGRLVEWLELGLYMQTRAIEMRNFK
jgi:23S rRNA G2445 N2-methylase RlmL